MTSWASRRRSTCRRRQPSPIWSTPGSVLAGIFSDGVIDGQGKINIPDPPAVLKVKMGNLLPSIATFDFATEGGRYILNTVDHSRIADQRT